MNTEFDPLEAELRSLRPRDPSPQLKQQIAAKISASVPAPGWLGFAQHTPARVLGHSQATRFAVAAAALAACLLALVIYIPQNREPAIAGPPPLAESPTAAAFDATLPSVWQFRNTLNRSAGDLDAALDQHAAARKTAPAPAVSFVQIRGLGRSSDNLETLLGEL